MPTVTMVTSSLTFLLLSGFRFFFFFFITMACYASFRCMFDAECVLHSVECNRLSCLQGAQRGSVMFSLHV